MKIIASIAFLSTAINCLGIARLSQSMGWNEDLMVALSIFGCAWWLAVFAYSVIWWKP